MIKEIAKDKTAKSIAKRISHAVREIYIVLRFLKNSSKRKPRSDRND